MPENALARIQTGQRSRSPSPHIPTNPSRDASRASPGRSIQRRAACVSSRNWRTVAAAEAEMFARVRYAGPARPVVTVPAGAIVQDEGRTTVFVERTRGEFERREVSLGPRYNDVVVVTSGLVSRRSRGRRRHDAARGAVADSSNAPACFRTHFITDSSRSSWASDSSALGSMPSSNSRSKRIPTSPTPGWSSSRSIPATQARKSSSRSRFPSSERSTTSHR